MVWNLPRSARRSKSIASECLVSGTMPLMPFHEILFGDADGALKSEGQLYWVPYAEEHGIGCAARRAYRSLHSPTSSSSGGKYGCCFGLGVRTVSGRAGLKARSGVGICNRRGGTEKRR